MAQVRLKIRNGAAQIAGFGGELLVLLPAVQAGQGCGLLLWIGSDIFTLAGAVFGGVNQVQITFCTSLAVVGCGFGDSCFLEGGYFGVDLGETG